MCLTSSPQTINSLGKQISSFLPWGKCICCHWGKWSHQKVRSELREAEIDSDVLHIQQGRTGVFLLFTKAAQASRPLVPRAHSTELHSLQWPRNRTSGLMLHPDPDRRLDHQLCPIDRHVQQADRQTRSYPLTWHCLSALFINYPVLYPSVRLRCLAFWIVPLRPQSPSPLRSCPKALPSARVMEEDRMTSLWPSSWNLIFSKSLLFMYLFDPPKTSSIVTASCSNLFKQLGILYFSHNWL